MKTIKTYSANELKSLAHVNFHTMHRLFVEKGINPVMTLKHGSRTVTYFGEDGRALAQSLADVKQAKKDEKARKAAVKAARLQAGLPVGRGYRYSRPAKTQDLQQRELPLDSSMSNEEKKADSGPEPTVNKVVTQLTRIADALERMATAWEARPTKENGNV